MDLISFGATILLSLCLTAQAIAPPSLDFSSPSHCLNNLYQGFIFQQHLALTARLGAPSNDAQNISSWIKLQKTDPWTFAPVCNTEIGGSDYFCVFTSQAFSSGRGISLVTTLSAADSLLRNPAFGQAQSDMALSGEFASVVPKEVPGKGLGLFPKETLHRGDRIFSYTPVLLIHDGLYDGQTSTARIRQQLTGLAVKQLPDETRKAFYNLMGHFGGNPVDDRIQTNAFGIQIQNEEHHAVFPETARINHECRPTTLYWFDPNSFRHNLYAATTIHPDQELSASYINVLQKREDRVKELHHNWGFSCSCKMCSLPPPLLKQSDERIVKIDALINKLNAWSEDTKVDPTEGDLLVELCDEEELWVGKTVAYQLAAQNWNAFGDKQKAIHYASMVIENGIMDENDGPEDSVISQMMMLIENPEKHWTWLRRKPKAHLPKKKLQVPEDL